MKNLAKKKISKVATAVFLAASLSACQSTPDDAELMAAVNTSQSYQVATATYQVWQGRMADIEKLAVYSPTKFKVLNEGWEKAAGIYAEFANEPEKARENYSIFSSGTYAERFLQEIATAEQAFNGLLQLKETADEALADAIAHMTYLDSLDARKYFKSEYNRLRRYYSKLFALVEDDEISDAKEEQVEFLSRAHSLEVKTVKKIHVTPLEEELKKLYREDVEDYAPLSYALIESKIKAAKAVIDLAPRDFLAIEQAVVAVKFELSHASHIATDVQMLRDKSKDEYEKVMLDIEAKLLRISRAIDGADYRDRPINTQAKMIVDSIDQLHQLQASRVKLANGQDLAALQQKLTALTELVESKQQQIELLQKHIKLQEKQISLGNEQYASADE